MGGAKGGSNFNLKGNSQAEVIRFSQSMMTELHPHIGKDIDAPQVTLEWGLARSISYLDNTCDSRIGGAGF